MILKKNERYELPDGRGFIPRSDAHKLENGRLFVICELQMNIDGCTRFISQVLTVKEIKQLFGSKEKEFIII